MSNSRSQPRRSSQMAVMNQPPQNTPTSIEELNRQNQWYQQQNQRLEGELQRMELDRRQTQDAISQLTSHCEALSRKDKELEGQRAKLDSDINLLKTKLKATQENIKIKLVTQSQKRQSREEEARNRILELEKQKDLKQMELEQNQAALRRHEGELQKLKEQRDQRQRKLKQQVSIKETLEREYKTLELRIEELRDLMYRLIQEDKIQKSQLKKETQALIQQERQIQQLNRQRMQAREKLRKEKEKYESKIAIASAYRPVAHFFNGDVLNGQDDYKDFLIEMLQRKTMRKIGSTKQIYRYDQLNKVNFHKYIDNNQQLVIVIKLANGYVLGAWTQGSYHPKMVSDKDGLIFSLTNKKVFELRELNKRAIAYDDFFLIVGNSEIRLKSQDKKLFSNFAISNGYYNNRGEKVDYLLGSGTLREVDMETFEVFQLKFS